MLCTWRAFRCRSGTGIRKPYPTDVSDEAWGFVAPYLTLIDEQAPQRHHELRELFNALRWLVRAGAPWRLLPTNFLPWPAVYPQTQRWLKAGCFEAIVHDLQVVKREKARHGFVLLPKRWVVERSFAWASRLRRLARDYERLPQTLAGIHFIVFAILMPPQAVPCFAGA